MMRRRPKSKRGCAVVPRSRRSCRAVAPIRNWPARRSRCWACADHPTYRDNWPLLEAAPNAWIRLRPGDTCLVSEQLARRLKLAIGDRIDVPASGWQLAARNRRHLCRLRQPERPDRGQFRGVDAALSGNAADPIGPAGRACENSGADRSVAGEVFARRPQRRRSGDDEGGIETHLQPHFFGDGRAQRLHARRRRRGAVDQPADPEQFPPAATGAAMGDRHHAAATGGNRTLEDACRSR